MEASERDRALVIFFTSFIVMATLLFNGPTTPYVAKFLGVIEDPTAAHEALQQEAKEYVTYKVTRDFRRVKHGVLDSILGGSAKRDIVAQYVSLGPFEESQQAPERSLALGMDDVERGKDGFENGLAGIDPEDATDEEAPKLSPTSNSSPSRISTVMEDAEGEERAAREDSGSGRARGRTVAATRDSTSEATPPAESETLPSTPASASPPPSPPQPGSPSSLPTSPEATMTHSASRSLSKRVLDLAAQENAERSGTHGSEDSQDADAMANEKVNARVIRSVADLGVVTDDADAMAYEKVNARVIRSVADLGVVTGDAHSSSPHMTSMSRDASVAALNELATKKGFAHGFAMREHDARAKGHAETGGAVLEMLRRTATLQVESEEAKAWKTDVSEDQRREKVYNSVRCSVSKELRTRFYMGLQRAYWNQLTEGYLEERAANVLIDVTDEAIEQVSMEMFSDWDVLKRHCPEGKELRTWYQRLWARANYFAGQYVGFSFSNDVVTGASLAVSYILAHREATAFLRRVLGAGVRRIARKKERESHRSSEDGSPPPGGRPEAKEGAREFTEQVTLSSLEEDSSTRGHTDMRHRTQSELDLSALAGHSRPMRYAITATREAAPGARERAEKTARATVEAFAEAGQGIANDFSTGGRAMINMGREVMAPLTGNVPAPDGEQPLEQNANAINAQAEVEAMDDHAATAGGSSSPRPAARVHGRGMDLYERLSSSGEMLKRTKTHHVVLPQPIAGPGTHEEDVTGEEISICHSTVKNELTRLHEMSEVNEAHALAYLQRLAEVRPEVLENLRTVQVINLMLTREAHVVEDLYKEGVVNEQDKEHYLEELNDKRVRANRRFLGLGAVVSNERAFRRSHGTRVLPNDESRRAGAGSSRREQGASQQLYDDQRRPWWRLWSSRSSASDASQRATGDEHIPDSGSTSEKAPWRRFWAGR